MSSRRLFVGLISGTSADAIDCALMQEEAGLWTTVTTLSCTYPDALRDQLTPALTSPASLTVPAFAALDARLGIAFGEATLALLSKAGKKPADITAIGSHGQTLYHAPDDNPAFSVQAGCGARIAATTGITSVSQFRSADIAAGGQGAPLAPLLHEYWFTDDPKNRGVLNLGGIANLSVLREHRVIAGFDTGPANTLMDTWARITGNGSADMDGVLSAMGSTDPELLGRLLDEPYFRLPAPKSTGREFFGLDWLLGHLSVTQSKAATLPLQQVADIMSTLCDLSVETIGIAVESFGGVDELVGCGGGVHNPTLMSRLAKRLPDTDIISSTHYGYDPDFVEAALFAWLAAATIDRKFLNTMSITGATRKIRPGAIHFAPGA